FLHDVAQRLGAHFWTEPESTDSENRLADWYLVLHVQLDKLHDRRLPRSHRAHEELHRVCRIRGHVPASDCGPDRQVCGHAPAVRHVAEDTAIGPARHWHLVLHARNAQESRTRGSNRRALRDTLLCGCRKLAFRDRLARCPRLLTSNLLRL